MSPWTKYRRQSASSPAMSSRRLSGAPSTSGVVGAGGQNASTFGSSSRVPAGRPADHLAEGRSPVEAPDDLLVARERERRRRGEEFGRDAHAERSRGERGPCKEHPGPADAEGPLHFSAGHRDLLAPHRG